MKNIIYLLAFVAVFFVSCDPLDDVYEELDALSSDVIVGETALTLTDDDYDDLGLNFGNFNSTDQAKSLIPGLLTDKFPVWGKGSLAEVTYELYAPKQEQDSIVRYTVTTEDYDSNPETERFDNFDDVDQIYDLLNVKYPTPVDNMLVSLTYEFWNGSRVLDLNNGFFYTDGSWQFIQGLTDDQYSLVGENFPNFSSEDEADEKMPILLEEIFRYDFYEAGDIVPTMYKLFVTDVSDLDGDGRTDDRTTYSYIKYFIFDGSSWAVYDNTIDETLQFGHDGDTWVPDNTITYRVTSADIAVIVAALEGTYPGPASNVERFESFDRRSGSGNYWSDDMLLEAFNILLDTRNPGAEEGQKYVITIATYTGSVVDETFNLIKTGGVWVYNN